MTSNALTKSEIAQQKRNTIQKAVDATMHLLHDSHLYNSDLWPKKLEAGWGKQDDDDVISVGARCEPEANRLIINIWGNDYDRIYKQLKEIDLILTEAIYEDVFINPERGHISNSGVAHHLGQLISIFTLQ